MQPNRAENTGDTALTLDRRLQQLRLIAGRLKGSRMSPLQLCEAVIDGRIVDPLTRHFFSGLPVEERHYWIASLYALRMPKARRRRLAAYFTPPHLVRHVIAVLIENEIEPGTHRILDPASGGAAFLVPLAAQIAERERKRGASAESVLRAIESTLAGIEIEPQLAELSRRLLADLLRPEIEAARRAPRLSIKTADALKLPASDQLYDVIVANPPYGRVFRPTRKLLKCFETGVSARVS